MFFWVRISISFQHPSLSFSFSGVEPTTILCMYSTAPISYLQTVQCVHLLGGIKKVLCMQPTSSSYCAKRRWWWLRDFPTLFPADFLISGKKILKHFVASFFLRWKLKHSVFVYQVLFLVKLCLSFVNLIMVRIGTITFVLYWLKAWQ